MATKTAKAVRYDEIEGKTVSGAGWNTDRMLIAFTDGTVLALQAQETHDGVEIDFAQRCDIDLLSRAWVSEANDAGLVSRDEFLSACKRHDAQRAERLRQELARLEGG